MLVFDGWIQVMSCGLGVRKLVLLLIVWESPFLSLRPESKLGTPSACPIHSVSVAGIIESRQRMGKAGYRSYVVGGIRIFLLCFLETFYPPEAFVFVVKDCLAIPCEAQAHDVT